MAGDARLVGISTIDDAVAWTLDLPGVASCGGLALARGRDMVAVSCSGLLSQNATTEGSAGVLIDATGHPPRELRRLASASARGAPLGSTLSFASQGLLVGVAFGDLAAQRNDVAFTVDLASDVTSPLLDAGAAFALGDVRCSPGCGDLCFLADAHANGLRVWKVDAGKLDARPTMPVDTTIGLPPRAIGAL